MPGDRGAHGKLDADGGALFLRLCNSLRGNPEDAQGLQAVLNVGHGVVEIGLAAFEVFDRDGALV